MAKNYNLSDLGASTTQLQDIGATQEQTLPQEIGSIAGATGKGIGEYALGTAHATASPFVQLSNLLNLGISKIPGAKEVVPSEIRGQYQLPEFGKGTAYEWGKPLGTALSFLGGGEALEAGRAGLEAAPVVGRLAQYLGGVPGLKRTIGAALYGGAMAPRDAGEGAKRMAEYSAAAEAIPEVGPFLEPLTRFMRPAEHAKNILTKLSGGRSLSANSKSLAKDIRDAYNENIATAKGKYDAITDQVGKRPIYRKTVGGLPAQTNYKNLSPETLENLSYTAKKYHQRFLDNPTFENGHKLQSVLGREVSKITSGDVKGTDRIAGMMDAQKALKSDLSDFLNRSGGRPLGDQYIDASNYYRDNVVPYVKKISKETPSLHAIATGEVTDPANILAAFRRPEAHIQNIVEQLPQDARDKILFADLGKKGFRIAPDSLLNEYTDLEKKGLSYYKTPELIHQMSALHRKLMGREVAQRVGGGAAGLIAGHEAMHVLPYIGEGGPVAGLFMGGALGPYITRRIEMKGVPEFVGRELQTPAKTSRQRMYDMIRSSLMAQLAKGG